MARVAHLSDLHFGHHDPLQPRIHEGLVRSLDATRRAAPLDALVITGDVFDTSKANVEVMDRFLKFFARLDEAAGHVPTLLLPGNHDRRESGVFAPWTATLFQELARRLSGTPHVTVLGTNSPFLGHLLELPQLPFDLAAYDSSFLPSGWVSAGGQVRQEDLLQLADQLSRRDGHRPLLFLLHHHLVPTPVTDTSRIETHGRGLVEQQLVANVLPHLVGSGDREELTMTALGAGTALTTLHQLGRAVVVLHGHKHYPTTRHLSGVEAHEGDVLITSAGSCGVLVRFGGTEFDEAPTLWPSFNVLDVTQDELAVASVAWSPWEEGRRNPPRALLSAKRVGERWTLRHRLPPDERPEPVLARNEAAYTVSTSGQLDRYDLAVIRTLEALPAARLPHTWDVVEGPSGATVVEIKTGGEFAADQPCPARVKVPVDGTTTYRVVGGAVASLAEAQARYGPGAAFEWVGLVSRTRAKVARLSLRLGPVRTRPFGSITDLTTGKERPARLEVHGDEVRLAVSDCRARMLLRIYWPLEGT